MGVSASFFAARWCSAAARPGPIRTTLGSSPPEDMSLLICAYPEGAAAPLPLFPTIRVFWRRCTALVLGAKPSISFEPLLLSLHKHCFDSFSVYLGCLSQLLNFRMSRCCRRRRFLSEVALFDPPNLGPVGDICLARRWTLGMKWMATL